MKKKNTYTKKYILLDAHAIIHRAYHALPDFSTRAGVPTGALYGVMTMVLRVISEFKPDYIIACYDLPQKTFRHIAYEEYKGTRKKIDDVLVTQLIKSREIFEAFGIPIYDAPGYEADDVIGTLASLLKKDKSNQVIIASGDMDTMQLIDDDQVLVYTLKKGLTDTILYDAQAVLDRYGFPPIAIADYKGLRGDTSDNIIGVKGIGEKTATILIQKYQTIENIYTALKKDETIFKKNTGFTDRIVGLLKDNEDEAIFSKELATIACDIPLSYTIPTLHKDVYDFKKVEALCMLYEFKSLVPRLRSLYEVPLDNPVKAKNNDSIQKSIVIKEEQEITIDPKYLLAVSLLDSENNKPTVDDVLSFSETASLDDAYIQIESELKKQDMYTLWQTIEVPLLAVVEKMSKNGICIDISYFSHLSKTYHKELDTLQKKIWELTGQEFNINSPKQLGDVLFTVLNLHNQDGEKTKIKKTTTGVLSTKESELEKLRGKHPVIEYILEYREIQKLLSTYIDVLPSLVGEDGRIHSTFNQLGAATGRFSSNDPNMQNIPIKTEKGKAIRKGFISEKGCVLMSFDYSQIELRVAALLSQDPILISTFRAGEDIHTRVAEKVFHVSASDVTSEMRRRAKVINFGILYGMGATALATNLDVPRKEAQVFLEEYRREFPVLYTYLETVLYDAKKNKYTQTLFGRKRNFVKINSPLPFIKAMYERMAVNAPIQGTAADILKYSMVAISNSLYEKKLEDTVKLILQIHDEIVFEVREDVVDTAKDIIEKVMQHALPKEYTKDFVVVPLEVHAFSGKDWAELK